MGGGRIQNYRSRKVKSACTAENFTKMGLKSTILELQRSFKYKSSCTINFQKNEARKNVLTSSDGGRCPPPYTWPVHNPQRNEKFLVKKLDSKQNYTIFFKIENFFLDFLVKILGL